MQITPKKHAKPQKIIARQRLHDNQQQETFLHKETEALPLTRLVDTNKIVRNSKVHPASALLEFGLSGSHNVLDYRGSKPVKIITKWKQKPCKLLALHLSRT